MSWCKNEFSHLEKFSFLVYSIRLTILHYMCIFVLVYSSFWCCNHCHIHIESVWFEFSWILNSQLLTIHSKFTLFKFFSSVVFIFQLNLCLKPLDIQLYMQIIESIVSWPLCIQNRLIVLKTFGIISIFDFNQLLIW